MKTFERGISSIRVCPAAMPHNTYGLRVIICYKESYYNVGFLYDDVLREEKLTHPAHVNVEDGHYDPSNVVDGRFVRKEGSQYYVTAGYTLAGYRFYNGLTLDFTKARLLAQILDISEDGIILLDDFRGRFILQDTFSHGICLQGSYLLSHCRNKGVTGRLLRWSDAYFIIYAGKGNPGLVIEKYKAERTELCFAWQKSKGHIINDIRSSQHWVVLAIANRIVIFPTPYSEHWLSDELTETLNKLSDILNKEKESLLSDSDGCIDDKQEPWTFAIGSPEMKEYVTGDKEEDTEDVQNRFWKHFMADDSFKDVEDFQSFSDGCTDGKQELMTTDKEEDSSIDDEDFQSYSDGCTDEEEDTKSTSS